MTDQPLARPGFDAAERRELVDGWRTAWRARDTDRSIEISERYRDRVPRVPIARSPIDGTVAVHSLDAFDIDGLWWWYDNPIRPVEKLPPTWFAMAGAMRLAEDQVADTAFLVKPGPEAPFVIPRILERPGLVAVLTEIPIGPHTGYAITYFAPAPIPLDLPRINTWGMDHYVVRSPDGSGYWDTASDWSPEWDFDLAPWIERRQLAWIAPGDTSLELRHETKGCPFLGLTGNREVTRIQFGRIDRPEPPPPSMQDWRPNA